MNPRESRNQDFKNFRIQQGIEGQLNFRGFAGQQVRLSPTFLTQPSELSATFRNPRKVAGLKFAVLPDLRIRFLPG
jgi:hypothetical protein